MYLFQNKGIFFHNPYKLVAKIQDTRYLLHNYMILNSSEVSFKPTRYSRFWKEKGFPMIFYAFFKF